MIAQLGERQTEDLEVPGSIPGHGIIAMANALGVICVTVAVFRFRRLIGFNNGAG